jgi:cytochrome c-type biogenesis protein
VKKSLLFFIIALLLLASVAALELPPGVQKMLAYQNQIALSITFLIAFIGGILTFTSPCGFVVLPTFFAYLFKERKRALFMTAVFSLGMVLAFVIFGIIAGLVGNFFNLYKQFFAMLSGALLVLFGIMLIFNKGFAFFDFKVKHKPDHAWSVFFLGFFFAVGWTPCVGPILGGIIILAAGVGSVFKAALLFGFYALGVALPLMIVSYLSDKYDVSTWFTSKHIEFKLFGKKIYTHLYGIIGGILLIIVGGIMFFGKGTSFFMEQIPQYLPWTMDLFTNANEVLVESRFFTSMAANIIGIIAGLIVLVIIWKSIRYHEKE